MTWLTGRTPFLFEEIQFLFIQAALAELTHWDPCGRCLRMLGLLGPFEKIKVRILVLAQIKNS